MATTPHRFGLTAHWPRSLRPQAITVPSAFSARLEPYVNSSERGIPSMVEVVSPFVHASRIADQRQGVIVASRDGRHLCQGDWHCNLSEHVITPGDDRTIDFERQTVAPACCNGHYSAQSNRHRSLAISIATPSHNRPILL